MSCVVDRRATVATARPFFHTALFKIAMSKAPSATRFAEHSFSNRLQLLDLFGTVVGTSVRDPIVDCMQRCLELSTD